MDEISSRRIHSFYDLNNTELETWNFELGTRVRHNSSSPFTTLVRLHLTPTPLLPASA